MTIDDDSRRHRRRAVVGTAGLTAVLGSGAYLTTTWIVNDDSRPVATTEAVGTATPESTAARPASAGVTTTPSRAVPSSAAPETGTTGRAAPEPSRYAPPEQRVDAARKAAAENGVDLMHPVVPGGAASGPAVDTQVRTTGSVKEGGTMRVITAHGDLTGTRELSWVAGGVTEHGGVRCSQTIKLANEATPERRRNLLICWRTSAKRSVVTVTVDLGGKPSKARSVEVIEREWAGLG